MEPIVSTNLVVKKQPKFKNSKIETFTIFSTENSYYIGMITWNYGKKKYMFFPASDTMFELEVLLEIMKYLEILMSQVDSNLLNEHISD